MEGLGVTLPQRAYLLTMALIRLSFSAAPAIVSATAGFDVAPGACEESAAALKGEG